MLLHETVHKNKGNILNHYMSYEMSKKCKKKNGEVNSLLPLFVFSLGLNEFRALILFRLQMSSRSNDKQSEDMFLIKLT